MHDDVVLSEIDVVGVVGGNGDSRQAREPHVVETDCALRSPRVPRCTSRLITARSISSRGSIDSMLIVCQPSVRDSSGSRSVCRTLPAAL